jgi:predicted MFS family arabinose efflux permease
MSKPANEADANLIWKKERLALMPLAGIQFTFILGFIIMMPLGPQFIRVLHINPHEFGMLLASYTFAAAASNLLAATYIDRFDRRKLVLLLYVLFMVATLACGLAPDFPALLVARALAGASGGILGAMVQTIVADLVPFERRGRATGIIMAAFSASAVAGVPLGLALANYLPALGWRAPFFFIVLLSCVVLVAGFKLLPSLTSHMGQPREGNVFRQVLSVAKNRQHLHAFFLISLLMMGSFTITPYVPLYLTMNLGQPESFITFVYLCGGAATLCTSQVIGRLADKYGKLKVFRLIVLASFLPVLITTHLMPVPWWVILANSTCFFVLVQGRMGPGMAMIGGVPSQHVRGTYMSLVYTVQMLSFSLASMATASIVTQGQNGQLQHFNWVGYLSVTCGFLSIWVAHQLRVGDQLRVD